MSIHSTGVGKRRSGTAAHVIGHDAADSEIFDAQQFAAALGIGISTMWRQVVRGELPLPFYPAPRCPRWTGRDYRSVQENRKLPRVAKEERRTAKLAAERKLATAEA